MDGPGGIRLAATVMLLREAAGGLEVFMLRRSGRSPFAPDAFVFPGGAVDRNDVSVDGARRVLGLTLQTLEAEFRTVIPAALPAPHEEPDVDHCAGLLRAAMREVFEEAGILLARGRDCKPVPPLRVADPAVQSLREELRAGRMHFDDVLERFDWYADACELALFSHWITPPTEPRRYNTYFFAARAPQEQAAVADRFETHDERWIAPAAALQEQQRGAMHLVYPTIKHLERLTAFETVDDVLDYARSKPILTIMPTTPPEEGFVMPESLEGAW